MVATAARLDRRIGYVKRASTMRRIPVGGPYRGSSETVGECSHCMAQNGRLPLILPRMKERHRWFMFDFRRRNRRAMVHHGTRFAAERNAFGPDSNQESLKIAPFSMNAEVRSCVSPSSTS